MKVSSIVVKVGAFALVGSLLAFTPAGAAAHNATTHSAPRVIRPQIQSGIRYLGTRTLSASMATRGSNEWKPDGVTRSLHPTFPRLSTGGGLPTPQPPVNVVSSQHPGSLGFDALSHLDTRLANHGNQFSLEPPDQALCVGGSFVAEQVNNAMSVFDRQSHIVLPPIAMTQFFGLPDEFNRTTGKYGPFLSDPKCYYDAPTGKWFVTELILDQDPDTGNFTGTSGVLIAVSKSLRPVGSYYLYRVDTTNSSHDNCPCFGDQPLIGADANGFYVSTAEYDLDPFGANFNGPQVYAFSKMQLEHNTISSFTYFANIQGTSETTGTVQPATSPKEQYDNSSGGTEFLLSSNDAFAASNSIEAWALTNTSSLDSGSPSLTLQSQSASSEVYVQPAPAVQAGGPRPLGSLVGDPKERLNTNDDRMNQVVFDGAELWSGVNTLLGPQTHSGVAWFKVVPHVVGATLVDAVVTQQGYLNPGGRNTAMFPSIGVNTSGQAVAAVSLTGPHMYPSAAYSPVGTDSIEPIYISRGGFKPDDGFTGYPAIVGGNGVARWGDYSAAVADENGNLWMANEYIPDGARTFYANWGTFINRVNPNKLGT